MDAAAHRVRPVDLTRLQTLRSRREDEARRAVRAGLAARDLAQAETRRAVQEAEAREAERRDHERVLHAKLAGSDSIGLTAIVESRLRIAGWAEQVAGARSRARQREAEAEAVAASLAQARHRHAARMGEAKRWERVRARILSARRAAAEQAEEAMAEDDTLDRLGAARVRG